MSLRSTTEILALIEAVDAQIDALTDIPIDGAIGKTRMSFRGNLQSLYMKRERLLSELDLARRRGGLATRPHREAK